MSVSSVRLAGAATKGRSAPAWQGQTSFADHLTEPDPRRRTEADGGGTHVRVRATQSPTGAATSRGVAVFRGANRVATH